MKPPAATSGTFVGAGETPLAVLSCLETITKRSDFLLAARAARRGVKGMMVQARDRGDGTDTIRVGFTCSKKVGNAVLRNRAKRRLREVARKVLPTKGKQGFDYVLIGKAEVTVNRDFTELVDDFKYALKKLHQTAKD